MLPNPNLVERLMNNQNRETAAQARTQFGWPTPPAQPRPASAWRQWVLAAGALLLAGLGRAGLL